MSKYLNPKVTNKVRYYIAFEMISQGLPQSV